MEEKDLTTAVMEGNLEVSRHGVNLGPSTHVTFSLQSSIMASCPGTLILPSHSDQATDRCQVRKSHLRYRQGIWSSWARNALCCGRVGSV